MDNGERPGHPATYRETIESYPHKRFLLLMVILISLIVLIVVLQRERGSAKDRGNTASLLMQADYRMKIAYGIRRMESFTPNRRVDPRVSSEIDEAKAFAVREYWSASRAVPTPMKVRRLIIMEDGPGRLAAIRLLANARYPGGVRKPGADEVPMWRELYLSRSPLERSVVTRYQRRLQSLGLGWYEHLALADLMRRAGDTERAVREIDAASLSGLQVMFVALLALLVVGIMVLVDLILAAWAILRYALTGDRDWVRMVLAGPERPDSRDRVAGVLLESFVFYLVVWLVLPMAAMVLLSDLLGRTGGLGTGGRIYLSAGMSILTGAVAISYLRRRLANAGWSWPTVRVIWSHPLRDVLWGLVGYLLVLPIVLGAGILSHWILRDLPTPDNAVIPMIVSSTSVAQRVVIFMLLAVVAPVVEELMFRGALMNSLISKWGPVVGIALSSLFFALMHPLPLGFLPILVLGSALAFAAYRSGSLLTSMTLHAANNAMVFLLMLTIIGT